MRKYSALVIGVLFLIYGGVRLGVSSILLLQEFTLIDFEPLRDPLVEIAAFMKEKGPSSIVALSGTGYLIYLWVMGATLTVGAIGCLRKQLYGFVSLSVFLVAYVMLFINFQTINPKVIHLIVSALLFGVLVWLRKTEKPDTNANETSVR